MDRYRSESPLAAVQGCAIGLVVAAILWALLLAGAAWVIHQLVERVGLP